MADRLADRLGVTAEICFATSEPGVSIAVDRLRARGVDHIVVAPWFLAPGLLTDRLRTAAPDLVHAGTLGAHPLLADVVWDRYDATLSASMKWALSA
ncbi:hypothetical protein GCM10011591_38550 [Nocardia camponoti]|uniref:Sirohydrochlorin chelatase n=1 Tax=Nocardia camponoti TaxID=1616106 RepID=A0A917VCF9_9NOCA|nr:hypothetical protein GCM10011591_38550 [Nocardia camponoti]